MYINTNDLYLYVTYSILTLQVFVSWKYNENEVHYCINVQ